MLDPPAQPDRDGRGLLREPPRALSLMLLDRRFPLEFLGQVQWSLDGRDLGPLPRAAERFWTADLVAQKLKPRQWHEAVVSILTSEATPRVFTFRHTFRFVPEPPVIDVDQAARLLAVNHDAFVVSARVRAHGRKSHCACACGITRGRLPTWSAPSPVRVP